MSKLSFDTVSCSMFHLSRPDTLVFLPIRTVKQYLDPQGPLAKVIP